MSSTAFSTPKKQQNVRLPEKAVIISPNIKSVLLSDPSTFGLTRRALYCPDDLQGAIMREAEQNIGCTMRAPFENADHQCCEINLNQTNEQQFAETCLSILANVNEAAVPVTILPYLQHINRFYRSVHDAENENFKTFRLHYMTNFMIDNVLNNSIAVVRATNWQTCRKMGRLSVRLMPDMTKNNLLQMDWQAKLLVGQFINYLNIGADGYSICISTKFVELLSSVKWDQVIAGQQQNNHVVVIGYPINTLMDRTRQACLGIKMAHKILHNTSSQVSRYIYLERSNNLPLPMSEMMTYDLIHTANLMSLHCKNAVFEIQHVRLPANTTFENYRLQFMQELQILNPALVLQLQNTVLVTLNQARSHIVGFIQLHYVDECIILSVLQRGYHHVLPTDTGNM